MILEKLFHSVLFFGIIYIGNKFEKSDKRIATRNVHGKYQFYNDRM